LKTQAVKRLIFASVQSKGFGPGWARQANVESLLSLKYVRKEVNQTTFDLASVFTSTSPIRRRLGGGTVRANATDGATVGFGGIVSGSTGRGSTPRANQAALATGLLGRDMIGLTLGHKHLHCAGVYMGNRLVSHECRHVYQYEIHGSIAAFLPVYLLQIATVGYLNAPFEQDARAHELESG
jgi:hypothetical protein